MNPTPGPDAIAALLPGGEHPWHGFCPAAALCVCKTAPMGTGFALILLCHWERGREWLLVVLEVSHSPKRGLGVPHSILSRRWLLCKRSDDEKKEKRKKKGLIPYVPISLRELVV